MKRGGHTEFQLKRQHKEYMRDKRALMFQCHPGVKVVLGDVKFDAKGPPDFIGFGNGCSFIFDSKETASGTWAFRLLKAHQALDFERAMHYPNTYPFVFIAFKAHGQFILPWRDLAPRWKRWSEEGGKPASIRHDDVDLIPVDGYDWLTALENSW